MKKCNTPLCSHKSLIELSNPKDLGEVLVHKAQERHERYTSLTKSNGTKKRLFAC